MENKPENKAVQPFKNPEIVVLRNPIARAKFGLSLVQTKFLFEVLAFFKSNPEKRLARFYLRDYLSKLGVSSNNFKGYVTQIEELRRHDIRIPTTAKGNRELNFIGLSLFASSEYQIDENGDGYIEIEVSDKLKPYFLEIANGEFFYYHILNTRVLKSTYSIKLYLLLKSYRRFGKLEVMLEELREILEIEPTAYPLYKNFKARILETARLEILEKTDLSFEYEDVRRNRKSPVEKIVFYIHDNPNAKEILEKNRTIFTKITPPTLFEQPQIVVKEQPSRVEEAVIVESHSTPIPTPKTPEKTTKSDAPKDFKKEILSLFRQFDREATDEEILGFTDSYESEKVADVLFYAVEQTRKGKTDIKNIYPYIVAGVRAGYGKGLAAKSRNELSKGADKLRRQEELAQSKTQLDTAAAAYERAKNEKIRALTSADPSITTAAIERVKQTFGRITPSVFSMTIDDFRISPMYNEFVKKEIYEAFIADFVDIDRTHLPQIERLRGIVKEKEKLA
jgi:plasmid replication initiation protein